MVLAVLDVPVAAGEAGQFYPGTDGTFTKLVGVLPGKISVGSSRSVT
jgi:hypothetical protein